MDTEASKLELFTESHREHDERWTVRASGDDVTCFACLMELLEDPQLLRVKKKLVLAELLRFLTYHTEYMLDVLSGDFRVIVHATVILLDLMEEADETFASMAVEGVLKLVMSVKVDDLMCGLVDSASEKCLEACNYKKSLPFFNLVGKLLQGSPPLSSHLLRVYGSFVDFLCVGLTYPDASVHISLSYIFICLYAQHCRTLVSAQLSQQVATHVVDVLNNGSLEHDSMMNFLGLMRVMLEDESLVSIYASQEGLCSALKKVLLGRDQMLQIAAAQCLVSIIAKSRTHMEMFLDKDMAEFLFEALSTCNELLISSLFCCLILFTDSDAFFGRCHAVYGIEAILRALEQTMKQKNPDCIQHGMQLLAVILERHTGGVRLFSCASMVKQCLALINEGIQHHNFQLSDYAISALVHILRREHLPSPVPFEALLTPIYSLLVKVDRCPRMHCLPVEPSHVKGRKGNEAGVTSWRSEQKIKAALIIVNKACNLAVLCVSDPCASEETFSAPPQQQQQQLQQQQHGDDDVPATTTGSLQQFIYSLLKITDESCVPVFMANYEYLTETKVFTAFLSLLSHVFELWPSAADTFIRKLVFAGIVRLTLEVSTKYGLEVKDCAISFLRLLTKHFLDQADGGVSSSFRQDLSTGIAELIASYNSDTLHVLRLSTGDSPDNSLRCVHYAALSLLHVSYTHEDRLAPEGDMCDAVQSYISLHSPLDRLLHPLFKYLVLLLAGTCVNAKKQAIPEVTQSIAERVKTCDRAALWCTRDAVLLQWCFSCEFTAQSFGAQLVRFWMSMEHEESEQEDKRNDTSQWLLATAQSSSVCVKTILAMLVDEPLESIVKVASCLRSILRAKQEGRTLESAALIKHFLPDILQKCLLNFTRSTDVPNACVLMDLYADVKHQNPSDPLTTTDLSLAYHVCSVLTAIQKDQQKQQQKAFSESAFQFLNILLVQSMWHDDNRVGALLCSNASFLGLLETEVRESMGCSGSQLVTLLLMQRNTPPVDQTIHVDIATRLQPLQSCDIALVTSSLMFWSAYMDAAGVNPTPLVTLDDTGRRPRLLETRVVGLGMDTSHIRLLLIYIQQHLLRDHELIQEACLSCLESLLKYIQAADTVCKQLAQQPWMEFLLDVAFLQHRTAQLPRWLWRLSDILLRYQVPSLSTKHLDVLVNCFLQCDGEAVDSSMVRLVTHVLDKKLVSLEGDCATIAKIKLQGCASKLTTDNGCTRHIRIMTAICSLSETWTNISECK